MNADDLKSRTKKFALDILNLVDELGFSPSYQIICGQLGRSGTALAANYRAACRARTHKEFIAKLGVVIEEADESNFWLDLLHTRHISKDKLQVLLREANELTAIFTASQKTAKERERKTKKQSALKSESQS